jgi:hypothetical protein
MKGRLAIVGFYCRVMIVAANYLLISRIFKSRKALIEK